MSRRQQRYGALTLVAWCASVGGIRGARAQGLPVTPMAAPVLDSGYSIQIFQGPVLAPTRVLGFAGANSPLAEGVEGTYVNAAAPAVREAFSARWFDWDGSVGLSLPGAYAQTDFENRGSRNEEADGGKTSRFRNFYIVNMGGVLQLGPFGLAVTNDIQGFQLASATESDAAVNLSISRTRALVAMGYLDGQLLVGGGVRAVGLDFSANLPSTSAKGLFSLTGGAPEVGAILRPNGYPFRVAVTVRSGVSVNVSSSKADLGMAKKGTFLLPNRVVLPWEVEGGVAMQFGSRPLNPAWIDPIAHIAPFRQRIDEARADRARERSILASQMAVKESSASVLREKIAAFDAEDEELRRGEDRALALEEARLLAVRNARYKNWPREKLLLSATVLVSGATSDSVSVQGFVDQRLEPYGRSVTVTPHLGVETEPLPQRLQWRGGIYLEPARFEDANPRVHGTAGLDIRLWTVNAFGLFPHPWTLRLALDLASRYTNWGVSLGPWH